MSNKFEQLYEAAIAEAKRVQEGAMGFSRAGRCDWALQGAEGMLK